MPEIEPFQHFLARTQEARPEQYKTALDRSVTTFGITPEAARAEFEKMKAYILAFYQGVHPVRSSPGDTPDRPIDCVPFEQQPAVRAARAAGHKVAPPPPESGTTRGLQAVQVGPDGPPTGNTSAPSRQEAECPGGTVPIPRLTLEWLVRFGTLDNYFRKTPRGLAPGAGASS